MNKVIVITGASDGIGAALAGTLGGAGAKLVLAARRSAELAAVAKASGDALPVVADVTKRAEVHALLDRAISHFGHVDVWVNNAGRGISRPVLELTDEDFDEMMMVNVKSALYGMQVAVPHFKARQQGHLVNVSSMLSRIPFASARSAYSAAKHALNSLTANLRSDLQADFPQVRVSLVIPGVVATGFGLNARGGGPDSRALPNAQPVAEVALAMKGLIEQPADELYTRPMYLQQVAAYYQATERKTEALAPGAR
jgi:NAD(P)-dependent dehydrogenase (short-subunit alcohol dehydrogenase family)